MHCIPLTHVQVNGKQGQFGAVASILSTIEGSSGVYDSETLHTLWRVINEPQHKPANAFSSLLEHLSRNSGGTPDVAFSPRDRWLASQLGMALVKMYADTQHWQNGFVILHHLHRFGVHYISHCLRPAALPLSQPLPSSLCSLAAMAVTTCLKVGQISGALEVLKGCQWLHQCSPEEAKERTRLLVTVAEGCLEGNLFKECWKCLQEVCSLKIPSSFFGKVASVYNTLLDGVLKKDVTFALTIYRELVSYGLPCLPSVCSALIQVLCDEKQASVAIELCKAAMSKQFYPPMARGDLFCVTLPPGVCRLEMQLLLEEHLHCIGREPNRQHHIIPLSINCDKGKGDGYYGARHHWILLLFKPFTLLYFVCIKIIMLYTIL